ncbi:MAG: PIN domain nuclease [Desulfurococcales archaeon ex4484_58]|nr:MAG: PIN domain nuclease [Desulfurococcales archaeon ex4484_58]
MRFLDKIKILLDSTYLFPIIGVRVEGIEKALLVLRELRRRGLLEIYYTPFNILEIIGKISRIKYDYNIVSKGLTLIEEEFILIAPTTKGYLKALILKSKGFKDLIDLLLYTTALTRNLKFLTRDRDLIDFLKREGEELENILYEEDFIKEYNVNE